MTLRLYMIAVDSEKPLTPTFHEARKLGSMQAALHVMKLGEALAVEPNELRAILADMDKIIRDRADPVYHPLTPETQPLPLEPDPPGRGFDEWQSPPDWHDRQAAEYIEPQEIDEDPDDWRKALPF